MKAEKVSERIFDLVPHFLDIDFWSEGETVIFQYVDRILCRSNENGLYAALVAT